MKRCTDEAIDEINHRMAVQMLIDKEPIDKIVRESELTLEEIIEIQKRLLTKNKL